jgi:hypothetical protein
MMGVASVIMWHALRREELELSPSLETESSLLGDSSRMACNDGDPLWVMPLNATPELAPLLVADLIHRSSW